MAPMRAVSPEASGRPTQTAAEVLRIEAQALLAAVDRLDEDAFTRAVQLLASCKGKAIVTGAGTSGIIARKIAATLTSTGAPAVFVHPSDALHGGLGVVSGDDVVITVSNSGETAEVLALLPYLRSRNVPVISLTGNLGSTLALASNVVIDARAKREACPFDLAPTSSTTVALAAGDALAVLLLQVNGLTPEGFALNHPSGRLGRRLTLRVADVMQSGDDWVSVGLQATWLEVVGSLSAGGLGAVTVLDDDRRLLGIITDGDLRRTVQRTAPERFPTLTAESMMTPRPVTVEPGVLAFDALQHMEDRPSQISVLPVVDDAARCVGIVRLHDIVRAGI